MNHRLACTLAVLVIISTGGNFAHAERLAGPVESPTIDTPANIRPPDINLTAPGLSTDIEINKSPPSKTAGIVPDLNNMPPVKHISSPQPDRDQKSNAGKCEIVEKKCSNICSPSSYQWASVNQCVEQACSFVHKDCKEAVVHMLENKNN